MSIWAKQEICLNLKQIRCLTTHPSGYYALRFHIYHKINHTKHFAIPVSIMQTGDKPESNENQLEQTSYTTKKFMMKTGQTTALNEICIFKNQVNIFTYEPDYNDLNLSIYCEFLRIDFNQKKTVSGVFEGRLFGASVSDFLLLDFYEGAASQVKGSIHSCIYQYQFLSKNPKYSSFQKFCDAQPSQYVEQLLRYLLKEGKVNLGKLRVLMELFGVKKEEKKLIEPVQFEEKPLEKNEEIDLFRSIKAQSKLIIDYENQLKEEKDLETRPAENEITDIEEQKLQNLRKKRKKIFSKKQQKPLNKSYLVTIQEFEKILHENAQSIYQEWREFLTLLTVKQNESVLKHFGTQYERKINKLVGESIVRFKGTLDIDLYSKEETQRNKMAYQARTLLSPNCKQTNQFSFYNVTYFSQYRPIFFEEFVPPFQIENYQSEPSPLVFIILVHGLGACRLDMEKLKVQLRRYYRDRVKILVSVANEGRTEGDIDTMGLRLASQIEHELAKVKNIPPITFIGHSMGGLMIRSALPRLQKFSKYFNSFITLSTPHIGFAYSSSKLVDAGLWVINSWKKCQSILQLTMNDKTELQECFLYKLSQVKGLEWFKKVVFIGSHQDMYVPYYSARIQKPQECLTDCKNKVVKGIIHNQMINSILNQIRGKIYRTDVNFSIPEQNLDNLIGRAAHISFVQNVEMLRLFCLTGQDLIF